MNQLYAQQQQQWGFFIYVVYGFKNSQEKKSALMYPKTSCIIFRKEQHDFCQHCIQTHAHEEQPPPQTSKVTFFWRQRP